MTRYVIQNNLNNIISESSYYVDPDGNQYGPDFPKNGLPGLSPILETREPELNRLTDPPYDPEHPEIIPAYHSDWVLFNPALQAYSGAIELLNGIYTQVWTIRSLTAEELAGLELARIAEIRANRPPATDAAFRTNKVGHSITSKTPTKFTPRPAYLIL
jgi:hypothetical protein